MNNNFYVLTKLLRKKRIDAHLILFDTDNFYLPEQEDSFLLKGYPDWIKRVQWGNPWSLFFTSNKKIYADLADFDLYITCGYGPSFLNKTRINNNDFSAKTHK